MIDDSIESGQSGRKLSNPFLDPPLQLHVEEMSAEDVLKLRVPSELYPFKPTWSPVDYSRRGKVERIVRNDGPTIYIQTTIHQPGDSMHLHFFSEHEGQIVGNLHAFIAGPQYESINPMDPNSNKVPFCANSRLL